MTSELKPCPFCGSEDENPLKHQGGCYVRMLYELVIQAMLPGDRDIMHTKEQMREAWNTRAECTCRNFGGEEGTNGEYYDFACGSCGFKCDGPTDPNYCPNCGAKVVR